MKSNVQFEQDSGTDLGPSCFKGHTNGNGAETAAIANKTPHHSVDNRTLAEAIPDDIGRSTAEPIADGSDDEADTLILEKEDATGHPDHLQEFGAPNEKIAALRKVLEEMNAGEPKAPEPEVEVRRAQEPTRPEVNRGEHHRDSGVSLFRRTDHFTNFDAAGERETAPVAFTIADLRRSHMKRARKHAHKMKRRSRGGLLLTGLVLISAVTATMAGLYVMHPQIVTAQPKLAPALDEYVETVDRFGALSIERTAEWRVWLSERIGNLSKAEQ